MRVLLYGGGSVGLGVASCLLKSRVHVDIIARENTVAALRKCGLVRTGIFGDYYAAALTFQACSSLNQKHFLDAFYKKLVPDTAEHRSSTLQDILAKKKTEIDALNGAVIKLAKGYRINVPYNLVVYNMVKFLEAQS